MLRYGKRGVLEIITKYNKGEGGVKNDEKSHNVICGCPLGSYSTVI